MTGLIDVARDGARGARRQVAAELAAASLDSSEHGATGPDASSGVLGLGATAPRCATSACFVLRDVKRKSTRAFALASDPGERTPVASLDDPAIDALVRKLDAFVARRPADESPAPIDEDLARRLRATGYADDK
jgi:hypothetical protein